MQLDNRHFGTIWNNADAGTHLFSRGFTGHEHLDKFGLINMNGRLYDPLLGRFLSPDPIVQSPGNTQSFNRYSYCLNNPLIFTDPSGYNYYGYQQQQDADNARIDGINRQLQWDSYNSFKALDQFRDLFYFSGSGGGENGGNIVSSIVSRDGSEYARHGEMGNIYSSYIYSGAGLNIVHSSRMTEVMNEFSSSLTSSQKDLTMSFGYDFNGEMVSTGKETGGKLKKKGSVTVRKEKKIFKIGVLSMNKFADATTPGDGNYGITINYKTQKMQSYSYQYGLNSMTFGLDGSTSIGFGLFSLGENLNNYTFEIGVPIGLNNKAGFNFEINKNFTNKVGSVIFLGLQLTCPEIRILRYIPIL